MVAPTRPVGSLRKAWGSAKKRVGRHCQNCKSGTLVDRCKPFTGFICIDCGFQTEELPTALSNFRHHDLRHTAVTRMVAAGVPLPLIAKIVGWSPSTLASMVARYAHFTLEELRGGVETISGASVFSLAVPTESPAEDPRCPENRQEPSAQGGAALGVHLTPMGRARRDRNELYEKAWTIPLGRLAAEYGVSDVAMGRICKRLRIPVPGRGYWAKRAANLPVKSRPPLPPCLYNRQISERPIGYGIR
jgi:transposase-like protein